MPFCSIHSRAVPQHGAILGWCRDTSAMSESEIFQMHWLLLNLELFKIFRVRRAKNMISRGPS